MPSFLKFFSALLFTVAFFFPSQIQGHTVVISGGSATQQANAGHDFEISGQGFRAKGSGYSGRSFCQPCTPGSTIELNSYFQGEDGLKFGPATYDGTDYPQVWYTGRLSLETGSFVLPQSGSSGMVTLTIPFSFTGNLNAHLQNPVIGNFGAAVFSVDLIGQGVAILELSYFSGSQGPLYTFRSVTYNFQPTPLPEPATLILLGSGLTGLVAAARGRRKSRTDKSIQINATFRKG